MMTGPDRDWIEQATKHEDKVSGGNFVPAEADIIGGFPFIHPNCRGCGKPLTIENAWMTDGCPCNSALGVNNFNETRWRLLMELQQRQSSASDALAEELKTIEAAIDAAGGSILERNADFIADQASKLVFAAQAARELKSMIQDMHRRCGIAVTSDWIKSGLDRLLAKCVQITKKS